MPTTHPQGELSTSRAVQAPSALSGARSRAVPRVRSGLYLAAPTDEAARRRSRVEHALAAGQLTIRSERRGRTHTVAVFGELDLVTAADIEDKLMAVEATDVQRIILDLAGLTFMDSSGVHLIARANARCWSSAKRLEVLRPPSCTHRVFALAAAETLPSAA